MQVVGWVSNLTECLIFCKLCAWGNPGLATSKVRCEANPNVNEAKVMVSVLDPTWTVAGHKSRKPVEEN